MSKLGHVTITVEPHVFEATMYAIKDNTPRPPVPQPQKPMYPILQYGPPGGNMPLPPPPPTPIQRPIATTPSLSQVTKTEDTHMTNSGLTPPPNNTYTNGSAPNASLSSNPPPPVPTPALTPHPPPATSAPPPPPPAGRGTDPVIQMLAERAATDPELKALMRIVANGEASQMQLKTFQNHIDDLTRLQKARQAAAQAAQPQTTSQPPTPSAALQAKPQVTAPRLPQAPLPAKTVSTSIPPAIKSEYQQSQALRSKGPVPSSKSDISGVVFEFTGGNGDRYLFPKFSILEFIPGSQVVASFLIVRKGSSSDSPTYNPELDYYQPITIRIHSTQERQLQSLQKVVAPREEVQRYMNDIMDKATRAEYVLLAMRLPRDGDQKETSEKEDEEKNEQADSIVGWATTNPTPPALVKVKPTKKIPSEEEQYQSFIGTVAASV
jgi:hypothetical protein